LGQSVTFKAGRGEGKEMTKGQGAAVAGGGGPKKLSSKNPKIKGEPRIDQKDVERGCPLIGGTRRRGEVRHKKGPVKTKP